MLLLQSLLNEECSATRAPWPRAEGASWPAISETVQTAGLRPVIAGAGRQYTPCGRCRRISYKA
jgi:hypothetical protein